VREHSLAKVPNILVVGMREAEEGKVALRKLGQKEQMFLTVDEAVAMLKDEALAPDLKGRAA
jgi:threonyl-tRNA synthetase